MNGGCPQAYLDLITKNEAAYRFLLESPEVVAELAQGTSLFLCPQTAPDGSLLAIQPTNIAAWYGEGHPSSKTGNP